MLVFDRLEFYFSQDYSVAITKKEKRPFIAFNGKKPEPMGAELYSLRDERRKGHHYLAEIPGRMQNLDGPDEYLLIPEDLRLQASRDLSLPLVHLIREQRLLYRTQKRLSRILYREEEPQFEETIEKNAQELRDYIRGIQASAGSQAQQLDASFPKRLFDEKEKVNESDFNSRFEAIRGIQKGLTKFKLLQSSVEDHPTYRREDAKALFVYLKDTEEKLEPYRELLDRLELFTSILNERRFEFKRLEIDNEKGFLIISDKGKALNLAELSSGEKQEIVLLYELIFKAKAGTLVLIDEPEISLHVAWQKAFLNDLASVIDINKINAIVATHSPQIINEKWDLMVDLEEIAQ